MKLDEIRELIALMKENQIAEIDLEREGERLRVVVQRENDAPLIVAAAPPAAAPHAAPAAAAAEPEPPPEEEGDVIKSPLVGTFFRSPSPDSDPFVSEGDGFDEDTVMCIIEAMKVMNEIKAENQGRIVKILVENGHPVEFGQPLFQVEYRT